MVRANSASPGIGSGRRASAVSLWANRGLEFLWLMAVVLVPLAYLGRDTTLSEAAIAYVEVPKVALLRTLVALMAILWLVEWGFRSRSPDGVGPRSEGSRFPISPLLSGLGTWLRSRPTRWVGLAVWFYLGTTLLSTLLSGSLGVSLWGEVPGQDGFAAYTIVAYVVLFGVIATHLNTRLRLWRLLGAMAATGVLVAGYGVLQHYGYDFLGLTELSGGGDTGRVTSFMGNAVFSAAAMLMPASLSLMLATINVGRVWPFRQDPGGRGKRVLGQLVITLWVLVLTVQLLGITFTLSRGPWLGTGLALMALVGLAAVFAGRRAFGQAALILGPSVALALAVVQWLSPVSMVVLALMGLLALLINWRTPARLTYSIPGSLPGWTDFRSRRPLLGRVAPGLCLFAVLAAVVVLALLWFKDTNVVIGEDSAASTEMARRFESITGEVVSGSLSGRGIVWRDSWRLIRDRPWFEYERESSGWARHIVGYGPDLFRYTYLLVSSPQGDRLLPGEPDHAHNYLVHQAVEQGALGMLSSLGVVLVPFLVGGLLLFRGRKVYSRTHILLLTGLLATLAGRSLEQLVGVARVSDLTIFWTVLAVFVALPVVMESTEAVPEAAPQVRRGRRRDRPDRASTRQSAAAVTFDGRRFVRLLLVAVMVGGVLELTWAKNLTYPRAAVIAASGVEQFRRGDRQEAAEALERASAIAPDVSSYYKYRASVYQAFLELDYERDPLEWECSLQPDQTTYRTCLAEKAYQSQLAGVAQRPYDWRLRLALADSASNLDREDEAIRLYQEVVALVPASWPLLNVLAGALVEAERPLDALAPLEKSLALTGADPRSSHALFIRGVARLRLGNLEESARDLEHSLALDPASSYAPDAHRTLARVYAGLDRPEQAQEQQALGER